MFDHLDIAVADGEASRAFYVRALGEPTADQEWVEWGDFGIRLADAEHQLTGRLHVAFGAATRDEVDAWWHRMVAAGYTNDGEPGPRPEYSSTYYGGFILDEQYAFLSPIRGAGTRRVCVATDSVFQLFEHLRGGAFHFGQWLGWPRITFL